MSVVLQRESTEYVYLGVTGDPPTVGAEVAYLPAGTRPTEPDWHAAVVVGVGHALWDDAASSDVTGDYYVARLIGGYGGNDLVLTPGDYQPWVRLTDTIEQPVRITPVALEIA
ncbi:hypothetical protein [Sphaerimonospora thailandensis]|uniref:Uncharacterized protein n=1 Tax=Sphaerimonospora thailandensis TaxID=795644 RepID=A0A8J3R8R1_9ACTN|nr:hypothetical protein [Sphaerimonospora thailandensis]GIH69432.1 hypothetical protein Mth01_16850 [Sphaerimonospora thailandensis]